MPRKKYKVGDKIFILIPVKEEGLRWRKGYYLFEKDTMCIIRTSVGTPDGSYIYYVETRKSIGDCEEFIPISELENLSKEE